MDNGGAVFMEGANVGQSHDGTDFFNHFGMEYVSAGNQNGISTLTGEPDTFAENSTFLYPTGDCNYSIDMVDADGGELFLSSQDGYGRGVRYDSGTWRTIAVSPIMGAFNQSENYSTRKFLMMEYIAFLADIEGPQLVLSDYNLSFTSYSPGEDITETVTIENTGYLDLEIWEINLEGDNVFLLDSPAPIIVEGQSSGELIITFRSMATGSFSGYLEFICNDLDHSDDILILTGDCLLPPDIEVSETIFEVTLPLDSEMEQYLEIENTGVSDLIYEFNLDETIEWLGIYPVSGIIPAGSGEEITLNFTSAGLESGEYTTEVVIISNDPDESEINIPVILTVSSVDKDNDALAVRGLESVYPNPFNPVTSFCYTLENTQQVNLQVYDIQGRLVKDLVDKVQSPGSYKLEWQACNTASAIYFYRFRAGDINQTGKLLLLK